MPSVAEIVKGYGDKFPPLEELFSMEPTEADILKLEAWTPALARYLDSVKFLVDVTSGRVIGLHRFEVATEGFIQLSELMAGYDGKFKDSKVCDKLTDEQKQRIRSLGKTDREIALVDFMEKNFSEHDTAAATDIIKLEIGTQMPELEHMIEGVHFPNTSEDNMSIVFGRIANKLVYGYFMDAITNFGNSLLDYLKKYETNEKGERIGPIILPGLTHKQPAEPTTLGKKFVTRLAAIDMLIGEMVDSRGEFKKFTGKVTGAIGNFTTHYAAYPDIDWMKFTRNFVESFGLENNAITDQCVSYAVEAQRFTTIGNILTQVIKFTEDYIDMNSKQWFTKIKKKGMKGSSIMPNKSNLWQMEGAVAMLKDARNRLFEYATALPSYPHEGNMERSYRMRNLGEVFQPIFIGLKRITRELNQCKPNQKKVREVFYEFPGMCGSVMQTVLKRMGIEGDAYRVIQDISINPDDTYANHDQFMQGLSRVTGELKLAEPQIDELKALMEPANNILIADRIAVGKGAELRIKFKAYKGMAEGYINRN